MADIEKNELDGTEADAVDTPAETEDASVAKTEKKKADKSDKADKAKKSDKPSVFARMGAWIKSCKSEMNKIVWASPKSVLTNSIMVIVAIAVIGLAIGLLDYIFSAGIVALNRII